VSLLVTGALVAGGMLVGRWIMRSQQGAKPAPGDAPKDGDVKNDGEKKAKDDATAAAKAKAAADPFASFSVKLGDVVMRTSGDEAWLAGALVFAEEVPTAALYVAPDAGGDRAIFARPKPDDALVWLEPLAAGEVVTGAEPPTTIEHAGVRFERARRLPVRVSRAGTGAPDMGERAIVAEYHARGGERLLVVVGAQTRAWRGAVLEPGMYEVLPSGKSTLE
jgi:hypothetical protein